MFLQWWERHTEANENIKDLLGPKFRTGHFYFYAIRQSKVTRPSQKSRGWGNALYPWTCYESREGKDLGPTIHLPLRYLTLWELMKASEDICGECQGSPPWHSKISKITTPNLQNFSQPLLPSLPTNTLSPCCFKSLTDPASVFLFTLLTSKEM